MRRLVDDQNLQQMLSIWLTMTTKSLRNDLAERRGDNKHRAADHIARQLVDHMRTCGWEVTAPPPVDMGTASGHKRWNE